MAPRNQDLVTLIRAGTPLLVIQSAEEKRVVEGFRHAIAQVLRPLYKWSITHGLERLDIDVADPQRDAPDASLTLHAIKAQREPGVYLLLDFQPYLRYPMTLRLLREIVQRQDAAEHTLVLVGAEIELPAELAAIATPFKFALPDGETLAALVREEAFRYSRNNDGRRVVVDADAARAVVRNLRGLSLDDARRIVRKLIHDDGALSPADLPELARAKYRLLDRNGLLHFEYETAQFANVGGLSRLKQWVAQRRPAFLGEKRAVKLDPPKGVLLLGVQGCGKSLAAKAMAGGFGVPLLRLDIGTLYNKYHGETERNLRDALRSAELLAPCVLWIDEIEKALSSDHSDEGVSRRVLGYLLTWMTERTAPVFVVATANDVQALPAELLRKGRFDETFFVDLPDAATRAEIFRLHLQRRELDESAYDLGRLADASAGFSGAEIEQVVVAATVRGRGGWRIHAEPRTSAHRDREHASAVGDDGRENRGAAAVGARAHGVRGLTARRGALPIQRLGARRASETGLSTAHGACAVERVRAGREMRAHARGDVVLAETVQRRIAQEAAVSAVRGDVEFDVRGQLQRAEVRDRNHRIVGRGQDRRWHAQAGESHTGDRVAVEIVVQRAERGVAQYQRAGQLAQVAAEFAACEPFAIREQRLLAPQRAAPLVQEVALVDPWRGFEPEQAGCGADHRADRERVPHDVRCAQRDAQREIAAEREPRDSKRTRGKPVRDRAHRIDHFVDPA